MGYRWTLLPAAQGIVLFLVQIETLTGLLYSHPSSSLHQVASAKTKMCRAIAREVVGLSPYERRILDMIKTGGSAADKRIYKFAKRRLGSHKRALAKREDIKEVNAQQRARQAGA